MNVAQTLLIIIITLTTACSVPRDLSHLPPKARKAAQQHQIYRGMHASYVYASLGAPNRILANDRGERWVYSVYVGCSNGRQTCTRDFILTFRNGRLTQMRGLPGRYYYAGHN